MIDLFADGVTYLALGAAAWAVLLVIADRPVLAGHPSSAGLLAVVGLLELGLLAQAVAGGVALATTERALDTFSFLAYLVGPVLIVPLATAWSMAERTRWGPLRAGRRLPGHSGDGRAPAADLGRSWLMPRRTGRAPAFRGGGGTSHRPQRNSRDRTRSAPLPAPVTPPALAHRRLTGESSRR